MKNEKNIVAGGIILITFVIFFVFFTNQNAIIEEGNAKLFTLLAGFGMSLMLILFYLVCARHEKTVRKVAKKSSSKKKKK